MNKPVSYKLAKLLKEKGFDEVCQQWYSVEGGLYYQDEFDNNRGFIPVCECEAPTIAEVVMWLYEKHEVWVSVKKDWDAGVCFGFESIIDNNEGFVDCGTFITPTEAYSSAIEYALNNLV